MGQRHSIIKRIEHSRSVRVCFAGNVLCPLLAQELTPHHHRPFLVCPPSTRLQAASPRLFVPAEHVHDALSNQCVAERSRPAAIEIDQLSLPRCAMAPKVLATASGSTTASASPSRFPHSTPTSSHHQPQVTIVLLTPGLNNHALSVRGFLAPSPTGTPSTWVVTVPSVFGRLQTTSTI